MYIYIYICVYIYIYTQLILYIIRHILGPRAQIQGYGRDGRDGRTSNLSDPGATSVVCGFLPSTAFPHRGLEKTGHDRCLQLSNGR